MNSFLQKYGFVDRKAIDTKKVNLSEGGLMNYPLNPLNCSKGQDYNILFLFVDTLRYDMLTKEVMPNTWKSDSITITRTGITLGTAFFLCSRGCLENIGQVL